MLREFVCAVTALVLLPAAAAMADNPTKDSDHASHQIQAKITKVDPQQETISVKMLDKNGKEQQKTLHLSKDAKVFNTAGQSMNLDALQAGEDVTITRHGEQVTEVRQNAEATITHVDAKAGTVTVSYPGPNGKAVQRTFHLVEDSEYLDSTGRVAAVDVFRSGDEVLFVEADGNIKMMKKSAKNEGPTANKETSPNK